MNTRILAVATVLSIAISVGTILIGVESSTAGLPGCCSCACPPSDGADGFDTCEDLAGSSECGSSCDQMNCSFSFFRNGTSCSDPSLAATCAAEAAGGTMAPSASPTGLTALGAALAGIGAFYLRRRRA